MTWLAITLAIIFVALLGYRYRELEERVKVLKDMAEEKWEERKQASESPSVVIDPDDLTAQIRREVEEKQKALNETPRLP